MRIAIIGSMFRFRKGGGAKVLPSLSAIEVTEITDVSATISASLTTNSYEAAVEVQYGSTPSLGSTLTPAGSPFAKSKDPVAFSVDLTGLLPYTWVFYRIVVTTSKGPVATEIYHFNTLEPVELTDGNWVAMWDAEYEKNNIQGNRVVQIWDKQFDGELLDVEINLQPEYDASTGINLTANTRIEDGLFKAIGASSENVNWRVPSAYDSLIRFRTLYQAVFTGVTITSATFLNPTVGGLSQSLIDGTTRSVALSEGDSVLVLAIPNSGHNAYCYIRCSGTFSIDGYSLKLIKGTHLYAGESYSDMRRHPFYDTLRKCFSFSNNNQRCYSSDNVESVGTVYGLVKRDGADDDFVVRNNLDLIGEHNPTTKMIVVGCNYAVNQYYKVDIKRLMIRSVTDDAGTIAKLNEWFSRESHELPELFNGILGTGIWNDAAIHDDAAIPVTI